MHRFYSYLIYKLYTWGRRGSNTTPVLNVLLTLTFVHYVQLFILYMILVKIFPALSFFDHVDRLRLGTGLIFFFGLHYLVFYNKERWEGYVEKFKDDSAEKKRRGKIFVLSYLIGSIVLFFLLLPILFGF